MALFKVTTKRPFSERGQSFETGMSAEIPYSGSTLSLTNSKVKAGIQRQFKVKYDVEISTGSIGSANFNVEKYPWH